MKAEKKNLIDKITISRLEDGWFNVKYKERTTGKLTFDEMLGIIAEITLDKTSSMRHDCWWQPIEQLKLFNDETPD